MSGDMISSLNDIFGDIDLKLITDNPDFKEDSVREVIISPILHHLGYNPQDIIRNKALVEKRGGVKQEHIVYPDYLLIMDAGDCGKVVR